MKEGGQGPLSNLKFPHRNFVSVRLRTLPDEHIDHRLPQTAKSHRTRETRNCFAVQLKQRVSDFLRSFRMTFVKLSQLAPPIKVERVRRTDLVCSLLQVLKH
jgi:hypothetical protein